MWTLLLWAACQTEPPAPLVSKPSEPTALTAVLESDVADLVAARAGGPVQLVDVRSVEEFQSGHVPGAINLPIDQFTLTDPRLATLDKSKDVWAICASGGRSSRAAKEFAAGGWRVHNVNGGTMAWIDAGHPVE